MKKAGTARKASARARESDLWAHGLIFEIEPRQLKTLIGRRVVRRRALADGQRRVLERLITKSGTVDIDEYMRERLERAIRVNEDVAEFLALASDRLVSGRGKRRLTASDLATLDLMPQQTFD